MQTRQKRLTQALAGAAGQQQVLGDDALGDVEGLGDLLVREPRLRSGRV